MVAVLQPGRVLFMEGFKEKHRLFGPIGANLWVFKIDGQSGIKNDADLNAEFSRWGRVLHAELAKDERKAQ